MPPRRAVRISRAGATRGRPYAAAALPNGSCIIPCMTIAESTDTHARAARDHAQAELATALGAMLPRGAVLFRREETAAYECDALTAYRASPLLVVLPETEAQVAAVLQECHRRRVPVVARGAGTGLSGGAMPHQDGVVLSLAKFNKILKDRCRVMHGGRAMRCPQCGRQRGRRPLRSVLRPRSEQPDRLHHRRQRRRKFRGRALPEIRAHSAQCAARARLHGGWGARGIRRGVAGRRGPRSHPGRSWAARACWP